MDNFYKLQLVYMIARALRVLNCLVFLSPSASLSCIFSVLYFYYIIMPLSYLPHHYNALNGLICANVLLRNYSLTHCTIVINNN